VISPCQYRSVRNPRILENSQTFDVTKESSWRKAVAVIHRSLAPIFAAGDTNVFAWPIASDRSAPALTPTRCQLSVRDTISNAAQTPINGPLTIKNCVIGKYTPLGIFFNQIIQKGCDSVFPISCRGVNFIDKDLKLSPFSDRSCLPHCGVMANKEVPERKRRSRAQIKRLVVEFEAAEFCRDHGLAAPCCI
jgi:hypothetical protein